MQTTNQKSGRSVQAPEFPKGLAWINTEPLTIKQLRGKVVLIDFWTYSCVNCVNVMPHLRRWHALYAKKGLVLIGVHTPEFDFEKIKKNVEEAVSDFELEYPIVLDSDSQIWDAFDNHWWPRLVLISKTGQVAFNHVGEGGYAEIEAEIQKALRETGAKNLPKIQTEPSTQGGVCYPVTPELYLGFKRGRFVNNPVEANHLRDYKRAPDRRDAANLEGSWVVREQYAKSCGGNLHVPFMAGSMNVVAQADGEEKQKILVLKDGKPLVPKEAGDDIVFDGGDSVVFVSEPRMYRLLASHTHQTGLLTIEAPKGVWLYSLTFGGACD